MTRIDLHLHSNISKSNGDSISWNNDFFVIQKLINNNIKVISFTDHNIFDLDFYNKINHIAKKAKILVLPGIEINVSRINGKVANMLYIFSNKLSEEKLKILEEKTLNIRKSGIKLSDVNYVFKEFSPILIPHVGKSDYFSVADLNEIKYDAIEISSVNHPNYKNFKKNKINKSIVAFSDTHHWNQYPQLNKLKTIIDLNEISFKCIKNTLKDNKNYTLRR